MIIFQGGVRHLQLLHRSIASRQHKATVFFHLQLQALQLDRATLDMAEAATIHVQMAHGQKVRMLVLHSQLQFLLLQVLYGLEMLL